MSSLAESLSRFSWLLTRKERLNAGILSLALLLNALLEVVGIGVVPAYVGVVAFPERFMELPLVKSWLVPWFGVPSQEVLLVGFSIAIAVFFGLKLLFMVVLTWWKNIYVNNRVINLSDRLFRGYMRAPYTFHLERNVAEMMRSLNQDCILVGRKVLLPMLEFLSHLMIFVAVMVLLLVVSPGFALLSVALFVAISFVGVKALHSRLRDLGVNAKRLRGSINRDVYEGLLGVKEIKVLGREGFFLRRFHKSICKLFEIERYMYVLNMSINPFIEWVSVIGLVGGIVILFYSGQAIEEIVTTIVLFAVALVRLKSVAGNMMSRYATIQHNLVSLDTIYNELRQVGDSGSASMEAEVSRPPLDGFELQLRDLSYGYPGAPRPAIEHIDMTIRRGEAVGFVGSSGAGKTTLVDVILGVLEPTGGQILVNGRNIHDDLPAWQRNIGYIPQTMYLVDGSIAQNICLGLEPSAIDRARIEAAVDAADLRAFVEDSANGLETVVGDRGIRISGGQRQRIAIARALYANPSMLIMDEATSALDSVTESAVIDAVNALKGERTILLVAHRISTLKSCDRIVMLDRGQVVAMDSYDALLAGNSDFRRLAGL